MEKLLVLLMVISLFGCATTSFQTRYETDSKGKEVYDSCKEAGGTDDQCREMANEAGLMLAYKVPCDSSGYRVIHIGSRDVILRCLHYDNKALCGGPEIYINGLPHCLDD